MRMAAAAEKERLQRDAKAPWIPGFLEVRAYYGGLNHYQYYFGGFLITIVV